MPRAGVTKEPSRRVGTLSVGLTLVVAVSCSAGEPLTDAWTVVDSVGVRWHTFHGTADSLRGSWLELGTLHSDSFDLGNIVDAAVGSEGDLAVLDGLGKAVLIIPPHGDPVVFGQEGDGPGELRVPVAISVTSDGVHVFDRRRGRLITFDWSGNVVEEVAAEESVTLWMAPVGADRTLAVHLDLQRSTDAVTDRATLIRSAAALSVLGAEEGRQHLLSREGPPEILLGSTSMPVPIMARPHLEARRGDGALFTSGDAEVILVDQTGALESVFRWPTGRREVSRDLWDSLRLAVRSTTRPGSEALADAMFDEQFRPSFMPWAGGIASGAAWVVWVQEAGALTSISPRVFRIDLEGQTVEEGYLPGEARLLAAHGDTILVRVTDELGRHSLQWLVLQ